MRLDLPRRSSGWKRFADSMTLTFGRVHNGESYDLSALDEMTPAERELIEQTLIARPQDWRDTEALLVLGTPAALAKVRVSLHDDYRAVRLFAAEGLYLRGETGHLEQAIIEGLRNADLGTDLTVAMHLAKKYPTPAIKRVLIEGLRDHSGRVVWFGTLLFDGWGLIEGEFDNKATAYFHKLSAMPNAERFQAFLEYCREIGVKDPLLDEF